MRARQGKGAKTPVDPHSVFTTSDPDMTADPTPPLPAQVKPLWAQNKKKIKSGKWKEGRSHLQTSIEEEEKCAEKQKNTNKDDRLGGGEEKNQPN